MKIEELTLYTCNLISQREFYSTLFEFEIISQDAKHCSFNTGQSILTFEYREKSSTYHFAFNIPSNDIKKAQAWLNDRVELLLFDTDEIINFNSWNAKALYFYDPDNNIVEFISRKKININNNQPFSSKSVLSISEIGIASTNMKQSFKIINSFNPIELYSGNFERFCALGNDEGMFILVNPAVKKWFPNDDIIEQSDFEIKGDYNFKFRNGEFIEKM